MKKYFYILSILLLSSLLQGCIAAGCVMAGSAVTGVVSSDKRSFKTMADDEKISYDISHQIAANPTLSQKAHIVAVSYNHVVLLAGQAPTADLRTQVEQIAQDQPNVRRIFDEITIGQPTTLKQRSTDAAITANVKTRMLATTNVDSSQIKVVTEDGVVYLMGLTSRQQSDAAASVARNSTGVKEVVKLMEYISD
jgi:osmotically-inducible protein OsmY